ncbi:MAG: gamma-glutamyl-gamma-aminobutyrate hydrolase family protein [Chlamydiia bacterium]|nr:gamma-glutamyl-gamma-aminobutyrate hydrolase family protein [Chlamydiia bacterium]
MSVIEESLSGEENCFKETLAQDFWKILACKSVHSRNSNIHLSSLLTSLGYSNTIRNVTFSPMLLNKVDISGCEFINCEMKNINFSCSSFQNVTFSQCNLEGTIFYSTLLEKTYFYNCNLTYTCWNQATLKDVHINGYDSPFQKIWNDGHVLEGATFLQAKIVDSSIENSSLTNVIFAGTFSDFSIAHCSPHIIKRPVIGIGLNPEHPATYAQREIYVIRNLGGIPVYYQHYPEEIQPEDLENAIYETLRDYPENGEISRAQFLLDNPKKAHVIERVKALAADYFSLFDGVIIPGGSDIPEVFYKKFIEKNHPTSSSENDRQELVRSVFEFALLELCEQENKPVLGICRGCQIINIFFGGTLRNITEKTGPLKIQKATELHEPSSQFFEKLHAKEEIYGLSSHHQAIDELGKSVTPLLWLEDIIKLSVALGGSFILSQVHPEILTSEKRIRYILSQHIEFFKNLKTLLENLEKTLNSSSEKKELTEALHKFLALSCLTDSDSIITFLGFDKSIISPEDHTKFKELTYYSYQEEDESIHPFLFKNQDWLCDFLDRKIKNYERAEEQFTSMIDFSKDVFDFFFMNIRFSLLNSKSRAA